MRIRPSNVVSLPLVLAALACNLSILPQIRAASFVTVGPLNTARENHTATLLPNGKVLAAGGNYSSNGLISISSSELYDPANGAWTLTGSLKTGRAYHTATLLPNGKVLVSGGVSNSTTLSSAELYDPASGTWTAIAVMHMARGNHTATLLPNGKVLVAGGGSSVIVSGAELYDPAAGTWTVTGSLHTGRAAHTATLLSNGKVLAAGGADLIGNAFSSAELYDPLLGIWTVTGSLNTARVVHTATLLSNGKVLVAGGNNETNGIVSISSAELYDPTMSSWTLSGPLNSARDHHTASTLPNGKVLVIGGSNNGIAELYDPVAGTWTTNASLNNARASQTATLLPNGQILVAGGNSGYLSSTELYDPSINPTTGNWINSGVSKLAPSDSAATLLPNGQVLVAGGQGFPTNSNSSELYDPATETSSNTGPMNVARADHRMTLLANGTVLVEGGFDGSYAPNCQNSAELYNFASGTWTLTGSMKTGRAYHTATLLPSGKVLAAGGVTSGPYGEHISTASAEIYDPIRANWSKVASMKTERTDHTATLLPSGKVLIAGGGNDAGLASDEEIFDPVSASWAITGPLNTARTDHTATLLPNGKVLVAGGRGANSYASAELYDPSTGTWTVTGSMNVARAYHTAALLPNAKVLVFGGGDGEGFFLSTCELYDPVSGTWTVAGSLSTNVNYHTATLLPNGQMLIAGGYPAWNGDPAFAELFDTGLGYSSSWQPRIASVTSPVNVLDGVVLTGSGFRGIGEGSSGNSQNSPADYPVVQLRGVESAQTLFLNSTNWSTNSFTSLAITNFPPGYALVTVFVNGIPSTSSILDVPAPPAFETAARAGGNFAFTWSAVPGFTYQVQYKTNLSSTNWMSLGSPVMATNGIVSGSDSIVPGLAARFYRIALLP